MAGFSGSPPGLSTDPLWSASGDIVYATGDDASTVLGIGNGGYVLTVCCDSSLKWAATGDASGPSCSTDNAIPRFHETGGKTLQNSGVTISDCNILSAAGITVDNLTVNCCAITSSAAFTIDATTDIVLDADGDDITFKAGSGDSTGLAFTNSSGSWTVKAGTSDSDIIFNVNDGGVDTKVMAIDGGDAVVTFGGNSVKSGEIRLLEDSSCGCNYTAFKVGNMAANVTYTLPTNYASSNCDVLKSTTAGVLSWGAVSGGGGFGACACSYTMDDTNGFRSTANTGCGMRINSGSDISFSIDTDNGQTDRAFRFYVNGLNGAGTQILQGNENGQWLFPAGTQCDPSITKNGDDNTGIFWPANDAIAVANCNLERFRYAGSIFYVMDTANGKMDRGITLQQTTSDNEIFALKSCDVAHGMTDGGSGAGAETDSYFTIKKLAACTGGALVQGYGQSTTGLALRGFGGSACSTHTASGQATVMTKGNKRTGCGSGSSNQPLGSNGNLFAVEAGASCTKFIVDHEGDLYYDGGSNSYDIYCDAQLTRALSSTMEAAYPCRPSNIITNKWDEFVSYNEQTLIDLNILGGPVVNVEYKDRGLVNLTQLQRLHNSAIWQLHSKLNDQAEQMSKIEAWTRNPQAGGVVVEGVKKKKGLLGRMFKRKSQE